MRRSAPDRASVLPAKRAAASKCDTTPLQNRHDRRISTLLVEKTGSNSGKSTIIGGCNAHSGDSQPMPSRRENQSNLVTWGNEKTVSVSSPSVIPIRPKSHAQTTEYRRFARIQGLFRNNHSRNAKKEATRRLKQKKAPLQSTNRNDALRAIEISTSSSQPGFSLN